MNLRVFPLAVFFLSLAVPPSALLAQTKIILPQGIQLNIETGQIEEAVPAAAAAQPESATGQPGESSGAKKTPEAERKEKFLKLSYDRRPSTVLKVWATPAKTEEDYQKEDAEERKKEEEAKAKAEKEKAEAQEAKEDTPLTEEQLEARAKAEAAKKEAAEKAKAAAEAAKAQSKAIDRQLEAFQRAVTLSDWDTVAQFFLGQFAKEDDQKAAYKSFVGKVGRTPNEPPKPSQSGTPNRRPPGNPAFLEQNVFLPSDILGIADASPTELDEDTTRALGRLLASVTQQGSFLEDLVASMVKGTKHLGGDDAAKKFAAARLLIAANSAAEAGPFLPDPEEAAASQNIEALQLLRRYYLALRDKEEQQKENLENAWQVNQKILAIDGLSDDDRQDALVSAVDLAPQVSEELGTQWMADSFTSNPRRGMEVLAAIGAAAAESRGDVRSQERLRALELQTTAVESLLANAGELAAEWREPLGILAMNWLHEAAISQRYDNSASMQPQMRWDQYGNMYWEDPGARYMNPQNNNGNMPQPIQTGDLLEIAPSADWLTKIAPALQPKFSMVLAQLFLKVNEDERAFPFIEALSATQPEAAHDLANEFIRVWTTNHDPNADKRRTSNYMYFYGFSQRADSIPLTRSKQARNLEDLALWVKRLQALPIEPLDEDAVTRAFVTTHSQAEVYRLDDIQKVFGDMEALRPETMAQLLQTMRTNLASIWRDPKVQQAQQTKRKDKEIEAEILRGYEVATSVVEDGVKAHPGSWRLQLARAAILFDRMNYEKELQPSSDFSARRDAAFAEFARASELYAAAVPTTDEAKESADVYLTWFYASLGACDLGALRHDQLSATGEQEKIRAAIESLPGAAAERHMSRFANSLAARISSVKAELKQRYLRGGLSIAGDNKETREAQKLYSYYADLISEIQLVATVDGSDRIGDGQPFGLFVDLLHTVQIERESGGFAKYLTNQNNSPYAWNYGRPAENYRDKFEEAARETLKDHFDVLSVTFHSEKIRSRGTDRDGWRVTPYAYVLLQAKGPQVDAIPPLRMDMDFLDTSGYVVLPIESAKIPVDAGSYETRPVSDVVITETLDEREAANGKLMLEIKATGHGVVPEIDSFLDVRTSDFQVKNVEDKGVSVIQLDAEAEKNAAVTERNWLIEYAASDSLAAPATTFKFPTPKQDVKETNYQRYEDVDMVAATETISLVREIGKKKLPWWVWPAIALAVVLLVVGTLIAVRLNRRPEQRGIAYRMPKHVTPFTVISLLQRIRDNEKLSKKKRGELESSIREIEARYFATEEPPADAADGETAKKPSLKRTARTWIERVTA